MPSREDTPLEKVAIFVDVQNIYYTCRQTYQKNFDYNSFWAEATRDRELVGAYAYATDRGDAKQMQFQAILHAIGFTVKLKPVLKRRDGSTKADWDIGIALDVYETAPALAAREKTMGHAHAESWETRLLLGRIQLELGQNDEARTTLSPELPSELHAVMGFSWRELSARAGLGP